MADESKDTENKVNKKYEWSLIKGCKNEKCVKINSQVI